MKHFRLSAIYTIASLVLAFAIGLSAQHSILAAAEVGLTTLILGILETSMSFDNAIANASILKDMDPVWRRRFISFGMPLAVFGMRGAFPVLILSLALGMGPAAAIHTALTDPIAYAHALASSRPYLMMMGGAFLLQVALEFFMDEEKDVHWLVGAEKWLQKAGSGLSIIPVLVGLFVVSLASVLSLHPVCMAVSGLSGLLLHYLVGKVGDFLEDGASSVARAGVASFISLELMDASMSFDGVIGALAVTTNPLIITLGLGIGAMFVRSLTLYFVEKETLTQFRYLEHGAFWAILILAAMMFVSTEVEVPDIVTGLTGATLVGLAFWSSVRWSKNHA